MADWWGFVAIAVLIVVAPGPNSLLILQSVISCGRGAGLLNIVGILSGFLSHAVLCVLGLAALVAHSTEVLQWIRWVGAAILLYLGFVAIRATFNQGSQVDMAECVAKEQEKSWKSIIKGYLTCLANPNTPLFYLSVIPQFVNAQDHFLRDAMLLSALHCLVAGIWFLMLVVAVVWLSRWLMKPRVHRAMKRATGGFFIALGVRTAL